MVKIAKNGQNGLKWPKMAQQNAPKWWKMVKMVKIAKNGQNCKKCLQLEIGTQRAPQLPYITLSKATDCMYFSKAFCRYWDVGYSIVHIYEGHMTVGLAVSAQ